MRVGSRFPQLSVLARPRNMASKLFPAAMLEADNHVNEVLKELIGENGRGTLPQIYSALGDLEVFLRDLRVSPGPPFLDTPAH